ncbi:MAG TPA: ABC transporter ATP-binding protein [Candidatus Acidoferrum sp.]|jgi:branched-chain amino acid transport system ATP-binding protein|nr:ABC transporter ATP-binding protein [Candidatus Acidoferrum sp.]
MLGVTDLHARYGRIPILNGIRLEVAAGELVGVLGHNGMGKTTLLKTLMGFVPAQRGRITFDGADVTHEPPYARARRGLGYVPQGRDIFPGLSVRDNLRMGFAGRGAEERIDVILETFPRLTPLLERRGGALSGGEQQLLAIARCLAGRPKLILFDEPTEGIQPSIIEELVAVLQHLHRTQTLTIVLVEQNLAFIAELAQRVLLIQKGVIIRELQPADLRRADVLNEFIGVATGDEGSARPS